jgi:Ran-binding protein 3
MFLSAPLPPSPAASTAAAPAFGAAANGAPSVFGAAAPAPAPAPSVFGAAAPSGTALFGAAPAAPRADLPAEASVATGEEGERNVFSAEGILFEWDEQKRWRERGRGEVRVNVGGAQGGAQAQAQAQARVVMRQKGNLRLLLNGNLWPQMQLTRLEGGAVSARGGAGRGAAGWCLAP